MAGTGGVGSAALYHLARRGARVAGIDRFPPGHDRGSSHGETRIIRLAYLEHPDYVPLLRRAYELWEELAGARGEALYTRTGLIQIGLPDGDVVRGVLRSAEEHGLEVEEISRDSVESRFQGFRVPATMTAVLERQAGFLRVEACVRAHAEEAVRSGAEIRVGETVTSWKKDGSGVEVRTDRETYRARALVVAAGAWAPQILAELGIAFEVRRKPVFWFETPVPVYRVEKGCPCFLFETGDGIFYGFPQIDELGVKVAEHTGGAPVEDPLAVDRSVHSEDQARIEKFLTAHLPGVGLRRTRHAVCLYTLTPDHKFVVDRHPEHSSVVFAAGLSGHGYKFTSVLGEALADLALEGTTRAPIGFLSSARPELRGKDGP